MHNTGENISYIHAKCINSTQKCMKAMYMYMYMYNYVHVSIDMVLPQNNIVTNVSTLYCVCIMNRVYEPHLRLVFPFLGTKSYSHVRMLSSKERRKKYTNHQKQNSVCGTKSTLEIINTYVPKRIPHIKSTVKSHRPYMYMHTCIHV